MDIVIIGLPQSGKTTVFNALTRGHNSPTGGGGPSEEMHVGVVKVPDPRLGVLAEMYQPKKVVYPEITYWDLPGEEAANQSHSIGGRHLSTLQTADAYLVVVRAFTNPAVHHPQGGVDPERDLAAMLDDLALADLEVLERAVERQGDMLKKAKTTERPSMTRQLEALKKVKDGIEAGIPLRQQDLSAFEAEVAGRYQLLTSNPVIVAFNTDEAGPDITFSGLGVHPLKSKDMGQVSLCGRLEEDLGGMSEEEEEEVRQALGCDDTATNRSVGCSYGTRAQVSFRPTGLSEVRAGTVPAGLAAQEAAGTVHSDFQRGFIRAEVTPFEDLVRCGGIAQCRKEGVLRVEGKTYPVVDGDVIDFLVNV